MFDTTSVYYYSIIVLSNRETDIEMPQMPV